MPWRRYSVSSPSPHVGGQLAPYPVPLGPASLTTIWPNAQTVRRDSVTMPGISELAVVVVMQSDPMVVETVEVHWTGNSNLNVDTVPGSGASAEFSWSVIVRL